MSMPPLPLWLRGHADTREWMLGPGVGCRGSRLVPTAANATPAFGQYKPGDRPGTHEPVVADRAGDHGRADPRA